MSTSSDINTPVSGLVEVRQIGPLPPFRFVCVLVRQPRPTSRSLVPIRVIIVSTSRPRSSSPSLVLAIVYPCQRPPSPTSPPRAFLSTRERGFGPYHLFSISYLNSPVGSPPTLHQPTQDFPCIDVGCSSDYLACLDICIFTKQIRGPVPAVFLVHMTSTLRLYEFVLSARFVGHVRRFIISS